MHEEKMVKKLLINKPIDYQISLLCYLYFTLICIGMREESLTRSYICIPLSFDIYLFF